MVSLPYDPKAVNPRELARHYIPASESDTKAMMQAIGVSQFSDLYKHIPAEVQFQGPLAIPEELSYEALAQRMVDISKKNSPRTAFLGDGFQSYQQNEMSGYVFGIRNLTTSYTPYQPERSQGTLITHWIYQCAMHQLTGFEAINSSLYDRSTALFESICCAIRLGKGDTVIVADNIYPADKEVVNTHIADTAINVEYAKPSDDTGRLDVVALRAQAQTLGPKLAGIAFPQVNTLGLLEDVNALTDLCTELGVKSIAIIDPMLLATGGLKTPAQYGQKGADIICGEAHHLALAANFGGPGLGLFAVRYNDTVKNDVRATPGRFVGRAKDNAGRDCIIMVMSAREQHIRKDKATSNICSNQAYIATAAGASILGRGEKGMTASCRAGMEKARKVAARLDTIPGIKRVYADAPFWNEFSIALPEPASAVIKKGLAAGLHVGVDVTGRTSCNCPLLKISFSDLQTDADCDKLVAFFEGLYGKGTGEAKVPEVPTALLRPDKADLPEIPIIQLKEYYTRLAELNVSPDTGCFPLGSCTMKYNPYLNDWAAGLPGFTDIHPQTPLEDAQGCLEVLYEIQEWFKGITGLPGVTTMPVAGAQGELVGLKLIQAYHRARNDSNRNILLIPSSSHGTNFATAATAGFDVKKVNGQPAGIVILKAAPNGEVDAEDFEAKLAEYGPRIAGIMVTNPNTSGIFETGFKRMADRIHEIGGLVYMDGANMNAIAGWLDLDKLGVDAIHNNLHKTWSISHGGGGPGDGMVAVSHRLVDFLPGCQIVKEGDRYVPVRPKNTIGAFHRHWGNFAHKVRTYTYLQRLGREGVRHMSAQAVLAARYLFSRLSKAYPSLPAAAQDMPRMHEFILTLTDADFQGLEGVGIPRSGAIARVGKLFLDFGFHAPTVAFPEVFGLMIEPTESYTQAELDRFGDAVLAIIEIVREKPAALVNAPRFTPVDRVDEVTANRNLVLSEKLTELPPILKNRLSPSELGSMPVAEIKKRILESV
ncbi:MAG: aminomethyl-transferring glycine dehydrogenase subunit GcvPB [Puniceicoccales bacterium]|jgi:glycine dehydrogenase|nr:aminomethyl-transferring glycine dehydrogenase subunit GcvPB [Puniceicoccales bacterium]